MWSQHLFNAMARLARPGATLATFTSAGFVRRGLQEAGFTMQKTKGFGRKREMLVGRWSRRWTSPLRPLVCPQRQRIPRSGDIGGGSPAPCSLSRFSTAAGRSRSTALTTRRHRRIRQPPGRALSAVKRTRSGAVQFFPAAFTFARRLYDALPVRSIMTGAA
jgi:tRNA 5-methylaminomethyl-2-thiouridine biosynthesis bifunctional protein